MVPGGNFYGIFNCSPLQYSTIGIILRIGFPPQKRYILILCTVKQVSADLVIELL